VPVTPDDKQIKFPLIRLLDDRLHFMARDDGAIGAIGFHAMLFGLPARFVLDRPIVPNGFGVYLLDFIDRCRIFRQLLDDRNEMDLCSKPLCQTNGHGHGFLGTCGAVMSHQNPLKHDAYPFPSPSG
jgi:hypothetical protein